MASSEIAIRNPRSLASTRIRPSNEAMQERQAKTQPLYELLGLCDVEICCATLILSMKSLSAIHTPPVATLQILKRVILRPKK